jgi:predicted DNA-binding transcriptional regulator AlpA
MGRHRSDGGDGDYSGVPRRTGGRRYLSYADLEQRYGKSRVTIWRWVRAGLLPAPYMIGPNSVAFASDEIDERDAALTRRTYAPAVEA